MQLPRLEGPSIGSNTGRSGKSEEGGFSRNSAVIVAQLNKGHSDPHVSSPNQYALLESEISSNTSCNTNGSQLNFNKDIFPTKLNHAKLAPWAEEHAQIHQCFCKRESCYHLGDQFDEKYKDQKEKPW